jgi:hypothetical protein
MLSEYFYDKTCEHRSAMHYHRAKFYNRLWWWSKTHNL